MDEREIEKTEATKEFVINEINSNEDYAEFRKTDMNEFFEQNPGELKYWIAWFSGSDMSEF